MKKYLFASIFMLFSTVVLAQDSTAIQGHKNNNKFKQLYEEFATPNRFRTASGAPGVDYYQQQVDYKMDIELDDANTKLYGNETITYTNNSPDALPYLWVQLDQNIRNENDMEGAKNPSGAPSFRRVESFVDEFTSEKFVGGFNIEEVKDANGRPLRHTINQTMMRVDLPTPLASGAQYTFSIKWWYKINNHVTDRARSGYEYFPEDDNRAYVIAQFFLV